MCFRCDVQHDVNGNKQHYITFSLILNESSVFCAIAFKATLIFFYLKFVLNS